MAKRFRFPFFINILFYSCIALFASVSCKAQPPGFIAVNLAGYHPDEEKQAFLVNAQPDTFEILRVHTGEMMYRNSAENILKPDEATGDQIAILNFSALADTGTYYIRLAGNKEIKSNPFSVITGVYEDATQTALQSYYYHRCGTRVDNGTGWEYEFCHSDDAPFYKNPDQKKEVTGGWHDAGDYNKFSVNTALSVGLLLYTFELNPDAFSKMRLNIPEQGDEIPDLLDEAAWALDWLMKMQRDDGAIYHKVSQKKWTGEFLPHTDPNTRYLFEISSSSTAAFVAAAALGSRLFHDYDKEYAARLSNAALRAWNFLEQNPNMIPEGGFRNPPDVRGGEYRDHDDFDEHLWAAIELYRLTGQPHFLNNFVQTFREKEIISIPPISWRNFDSMAYSAFLNAEMPEEQASLKNRIRQLYTARANYLLTIKAQNNYRNLLRLNEYYWGSNSVGLAYAFDLIQAYEFSGDARYKLAAKSQMHYVLGRNPFNLSQVTGIGSRSVKHPYHQLSEMDNAPKPIPGMLVGGPNNALHLNDRTISEFAGKNYEDRFKNYLVNETAINYTAVFVYVSGYFYLDHETEKQIK